MTSLTTQARLRGDRSQRVFDALLRTLAEPGTLRHLPEDILHPDIPVTTWLPLALADVDVDVCIDGGAATSSAVAQLVGDATGARLVPLGDAWIATFDSITIDQIDRIPTGSALEPELGARVGIRVDAITSDSVAAQLLLRLTGPGVPGERLVGVDGLDPGIAARLGSASGHAPAGFDTWLIGDDGSMVAIPRSTRVGIIDGSMPTEDH